MLLGVNSPVLAHRIGTAQNVEEKRIEWSEGIEPRCIRWNAAALQVFDFIFPDLWNSPYHQGSQKSLEANGTTCLHQLTTILG